jgi:hypothetical protein
MNESIRDVLAQAAKNGEVIRIVYHGGSQPGTVREIIPIEVTETALRARDDSSRQAKVFKLAKIRIPDSIETLPNYDPNYQEPPEPTGLIGDLLKDRIDQLHDLGWHVELSENRITLHTFFKNGKPRRGFIVGLWYEEYSITYCVDLDGQQEEERRPSPRPYHVSSMNPGAERHFGKISKAISLFLEEGARLAPTKWAD